MVRIVSGSQQEDPNAALLSGMAFGRGIREARQANTAEQRRQMETMAHIQGVKMKLDAEKAKALADANARAQMGDVQAMRQQDMERAAQGLPPEMQRLGEYAKLRQSITDPKAIALLDQTFHGQEQKIQTEKKFAATDSEIQRAMTDGVIDEAALPTFQQRLQAKRQSGESPDDILSEISKARQDRSAKAAALDENAPLMEQMKQIASGIPPGRERDLALQAAKEYELSPSRQQEKGSAAKVLGEIQKLAVGTTQTRYDELKQGRADMAAAKPAPGLPGMSVGQRNKEMGSSPTMGFGGPDVPPLQGVGTHKTVKGGAGRKPDLGAVRKVLPQLLNETTTAKELADRLAEQGVALTAEVMAEVRKALKGVTSDARSQGAER